MSDAVTHPELIVPVGAGPLSPGLYAVACEFPGPAEVCHAAEKLRDQGFKWWDCYTPYYVHGLDRAMGQRKSFVPFFTLLGGLSGLVGAFLLVIITSVYVYPMDTQGKPFFSLPGFVPILDLVTILISAIVSILGMTTLSLLPRLHHPLWEWGDFNRATNDKFFVVIEASDPKFNDKATPDLLRQLGGTNLTFIGDAP
jgi:hypothetical protein